MTRATAAPGESLVASHGAKSEQTRGRAWEAGAAEAAPAVSQWSRYVPGGIRTHGPRIRNPVLYPAELRRHTGPLLDQRGPRVSTPLARIRGVPALQPPAAPYLFA